MSDDEIDRLIDRAIAEVMTHFDESTVGEAMNRWWDEVRERGEVSLATLDALALVGFAVLARERMEG